MIDAGWYGKNGQKDTDWGKTISIYFNKMHPLGAFIVFEDTDYYNPIH
jgi:hypothetical protein